MKEKTLSGYSAVFYDGTPGTEFRLASDVTERISPHAFDRTLRERTDVFALLNHDPAKPIGRTISEPPSLYLSVDRRGLLARIIPVDTNDGDDAIELVGNRTLTSMSFGFHCVRDKWELRGDYTAVRTLLDLELIEVSAVLFPAYTGTSLTVSDTSRELTRQLGAYSLRVQSLNYEPRFLQPETGPMLMTERADEKRDVDALVLQSRLRLQDRRVNLITERERLQLLPNAEKREAEIAAELSHIFLQERILNRL